MVLTALAEKQREHDPMLYVIGMSNSFALPTMTVTKPTAKGVASPQLPCQAELSCQKLKQDGFGYMIKCEKDCRFSRRK